MTDYTNLRKIVTGDIIVKCRFGNDIRRIPINGVPTYDELCVMMYRVFKQDIKSSEDITLKYQDEEGDMISLLDDIDITHAISINNLLKVTIYDKANQTKQRQQDTAEISTLIDIRDKLDQLIQSLSVTKEHNVVNEEQAKKLHRLTPAELASFLTNETEAKEKSSVKELTSLSPKMTSSGTVPYCPPSSNSMSTNINSSSSAMTTPNIASVNPSHQHPQTQQPPQAQQSQAQQPQYQQQPKQQPQQHLQQQMHPSYIQTPPSLVGQTPSSQPINSSNQQFSPYPPANNGPGSQQQPRQGYYVPPPAASMNVPPHLPPQPYRPPQPW